jgi:hypothetical protein
MAGLLWLAACAQPNPQGRRRGTGDAGADQQREPPAGAAELDAGETRPDLAGEAPVSPPAGGAGATSAGGACTPGARLCLADPQATRSCNEGGQWVDGPRCGPGSSCSGGVCVCDEGTCEVGVLQELPGYLEEMVGGPQRLHVVQREPSGRNALISVDVGTGVVSAPLYPTGGYDLAGGLAADAADVPWWCRGRQLPTIAGDLMKGAMPVERVDCGYPVLSKQHVYFIIGTRDGLFRRPLARAGRETVFPDRPYTVEVTASHIYLSHHDGRGIVLSRIPVDDLTKVQMLGRRADSPGRMFDRMALDSTHVYLSYADQVLRIPVGGGNSFEDVWSHRGPDIEAIRLTDTHVYWATTTYGVENCSEAAFWRRSKLRDDRAVLLARRPAHCPGGLAIIGEHVYAAVSSSPGPSRILRLKR